MTIGQQIDSNQVEESWARIQVTPDTKDIYLDLFLPVTENYRISDQFYGYTDSMSADNNPMVLVELTGLCYRYGTSIYAVDRVNRTMYGMFSVGYKPISEKATVEPQFRPAFLRMSILSCNLPMWTLYLEQPVWSLL